MKQDLRLYTGGEDIFCHRVSSQARRRLCRFRCSLDRRKLKALNVEAVFQKTRSSSRATPSRPARCRARVRACPAQYLGRIRDQERPGMRHPCVYEPSFHRGGARRQATARPALARACHLFPPRRPRVGRDQLMRAWRDHQHLEARPGGQRRRKIYALVGGFHLAPAPDDYLRQVMAELNKFDLEHVMPMHCSGQNFVDLAQGDAGEARSLRNRQQLHLHRLMRRFRRTGAENFIIPICEAEQLSRAQPAERMAALGYRLPAQEPAGGPQSLDQETLVGTCRATQTRRSRPSHPRPRTGRFDPTRTQAPIHLFCGAIPLAHLKV